MSNPRIPYQMSSDRKRLPPMQSGKPLIVHIVVNVELLAIRSTDAAQANTALTRSPMSRISHGLNTECAPDFHVSSMH